MPTRELVAEIERSLCRSPWPRARGKPDRDGAIGQQRFTPIVPPNRVRQLAPEEEGIVLYPSPFKSVAEAMRPSPSWGPDKFWSKFGALHQIDPEETLIVADFGAGSDTMVVIDCRVDPPRVLRLVWPEGETTHWAVVADTIDGLRELLGMTEPTRC